MLQKFLFYYFEFFNFFHWITIFNIKKKKRNTWKESYLQPMKKNIGHARKIFKNVQHLSPNDGCLCIFALYACLYTLLKSLECTAFEFVATWNIPCKITMVPSIVPVLVPFEFIITSLTRMKGLKPYTTMSIRLVRAEIRLVVLL